MHNYYFSNVFPASKKFNFSSWHTNNKFRFLVDSGWGGHVNGFFYLRVSTKIRIITCNYGVITHNSTLIQAYRCPSCRTPPQNRPEVGAWRGPAAKPSQPGVFAVSLSVSWDHRPNNYKDTKPSISSLLVFNRVYRLAIQSIMLVFSTPLVN